MLGLSDNYAACAARYSCMYRYARMMQRELQAHHGSHATWCDKNQTLSLSISQQAMRVNMPGLPTFFQDQNKPST